MDRAKTRGITGLTYASAKTDPSSWYRCANSFHTAAKILGDNVDTTDGGTRVALFNAALSIELLLKAIIVATGKEIRETHRLNELAKDARVPFSAAQESTLELLREILEWTGRYPVPTKEKRWNDYYDCALEKHIIRQKKGNVHSTLRRPETFPTNENVEKIWKVAHERWDAVQAKAG